LYEKPGIHSGTAAKEQKRGYLHSLVPATKQLWKSYRPATGAAVDVNYGSEETQAAYLLRYYPDYTPLLYKVLRGLDQHNQIDLKEELLNTCFFGCGAAPELLSLAIFLKLCRPEVAMLVADLFDAHSNGWAFGRGITVNNLLPNHREPLLTEVRPHTLDFRPAGAVAGLANQFGANNPVPHAHCVVMQNCLNEIVPGHAAPVTSNLLALVKMMRPGALFVMIDRRGYGEARDAAIQLRNSIQAQGLGAILREPTDDLEYDCRELRRLAPDDLDHLLVKVRDPNAPLGAQDGLIHAKTIRYFRLVVRRA
jgi:hypothetical protein